MRELKNIYLVEFYRNSSFFNKHIYEQYIFSSLEFAQKCVKEIAQENFGNDIEDDFDEFSKWKISITKKFLDCQNNDNYNWNDEDLWIYDLKANLIYYNKTFKRDYDEEQLNLNIGDCIYIKAFPWELNNPYEVPIIGVIANFDKNTNEYIVYTLDDDLKMLHIHIKDVLLKKINCKNKGFLNILSLIVKKQIAYDKQKFKLMLDGKLIINKENYLSLLLR